MKMWRSKDEWTKYALCQDSVDHTVPPVRGEEDARKPVAVPERVVSICSRCRVRPECIGWGVGPDSPIDVWVAGRFIPVDKRRARRVRQELCDTLADEYEARGEDV